MPLITETYYLSLTQDNRGILRLRCSQDDTLRTVNLKLYNNGSIFVIPSGVSASVSGVKQNGAVFSKPCTISQDRESVVLQLSSDITNIDGIIVAEIVLNDGEGGRLGTSNFIIQIEKNPIRAGVVQDTETPIEYINDFIEKIQTLTARLNNLITPSGDASLAEVVDARIGVLDSTIYQTLGARLNAEFQRLSNALNGITILESTNDTTDRTSEILSKLNAYGTCKLGKGDFYVNSLVMPEGSHLIGSANSTRIILLGSETNTYIVKPRSNCIIENISFYGGFTGTYSELIANSDARRHCIILDKFNDINSENVILSNIFINNFVGSAIVQRATNGCHCKDVVINMCYAGIDISNASYDGQCANTSISNTKFGVIQNGSNFVFNNCISKDSVQHIMSDQQNTECTFSSCTFFDSSLETTSRLAILSNTRNGFVFDNCIFDSSLSMLLIACDGIVIKGTNFVGSDTFAITVSNGRNTLLLITDCIADVEPVVTNAGTAARITSCYLKDGTAWSISEADITVDDELSDESENPVQNKVINRAIGEIKADLDAQVADLSQIGAMSIINIVWNNGYIDSYGVIKGATGNGRYSNQFYVDSGKVITLVGQGYNQAIAMICKVVTDGELYTPLVMSEDSTERIYKYVVTESGYYAVCVAGITSGNKLLVGYNFNTTSDNSPLVTTLTKHNFTVTANTSITEYFNYTASAGDKLALKLDIGFFNNNTMAWYYKDRGGHSYQITTTVTYIPYLFEAPEDITAIGVYVGKALIPASTTYTISVRKLSVLGVIPNDIYIAPTDGLYTTIKEITDCDRYNPYYIHLSKGIYDVSSEFTQAEIESANYSVDGFVGLCLTDGMYLVGEGEKENVVVLCDIPTTYSSTIRNQISTLNTKGNCGAENITVKSNNIRYAVHDDFAHSTNSKHVFKNCNFVHTNGTGSFAYGNGMNSGLSVELVGCVFVPSVLSHLSASSVGWYKGSSFTLTNCKAEKATIRNNDTKIKCIAIFDSCEIGTIEYTNTIATQYLTIEGTGTNALFSAPNNTIYAVGDIHKVIDNDYAVGMCLDYAKTITNSNPYWIVVGVDDDYAYLQRSGYISSNILGITAGNVGDYWTISDGYIVTGGTSANAVAKVVAVANGEAFAQIL